MSASRVVISTSTVRSHLTLAKLRSVSTVLIQSVESDDTVGVAVEMPSRAVPGSAPSALGTIVTSPSRPKNSRRMRAKSGCGSTAITRAPNARQARTRLPTDGVLGPVTWAALHGAPRPAAAIVSGFESVFTAETLAPIVDLVAVPVGHGDERAVVVARHDGAARLTPDGRHDVLHGRDPVANTDPLAFLPYGKELADPSPDNAGNAYPDPARRLLSFFADPDLRYITA